MPSTLLSPSASSPSPSQHGRHYHFFRHHLQPRQLHSHTKRVSSGAIGTAAQCATCGSPGQALEFFVIAPLIQEAIYTQRPLGFISASVDKSVTVDFAANCPDPLDTSDN